MSKNKRKKRDEVNDKLEAFDDTKIKLASKTKTVSVMGYEFDATTAEKLLNDEEALWVLANLKRKGCVEFQLDDGPHPGIDVLAAQHGEYYDFERDGSRCYIIEHHVFEIEL